MRFCFPEKLQAVPEDQQLVVGAISNWFQRYLLVPGHCQLLEFELGVHMDVCRFLALMPDWEDDDGPVDAGLLAGHGSQVAKKA